MSLALNRQRIARSFADPIAATPLETDARCARRRVLTGNAPIKIRRMSPSHDDKRRKVHEMYTGKQQYKCFGSILTSLEIRGFRGVADLTLDFQSPITALSGLNGTGKSTIAQLACCGYRRLPHDWGRHYVKDYFPVSAVDPQPFSPDARVIYSYSDPKEIYPQQVTVRRAKVEWSGYKRQPQRASYYIGLNWFIPKIERRDFSVYAARNLSMGHSRPFDSAVRSHVGRILGMAYDQLEFIEVRHGNKKADLATATKGSSRYSENHMGFGEGRTLYLVDAMEGAPEKSLFVLEEPETALHGDAQVRFAQYLVDVVYRRRHQVVLTTHSSAILGELGRTSVVYLGRQADGALSATTGLSTYQVDSYLLKRHQGRATICVEDEFAKTLLNEIIRLCDRHLLAGISFLIVGGGEQIPGAVEVLRNAGVRSVGVCDGDMPEKVRCATAMAALPGAQAPEKEIFSDTEVKDNFKQAPYLVDIAEVLASVADHHEYAKALAAHTSTNVAAITTEACRSYVSTRSPNEFSDLVSFLKKELSDRR
ncbi:ATP-dependent nuclease [Micromonospora sp. CPCC 205556]|uniref:ATP-dependent nuclease n=1 Tax=Micromonospora sp. CPCC 205556 TaxID=3122398 RepID=UPI002FF2E1C4